MSFVPIKEGEYTSTIYSMIKEHKYADVMRILQYELQRTPNSRAALSLLAYCYYVTQDFVMAAECYDKLTILCPDHMDYKLYHAQALYNAFMFPEAIAVLATVNNPKVMQQVIKLDSAIKYREEDLVNSRIVVEQYEPEDPDTEVNLACLDYKENNYEEALQKFVNATLLHRYQADLNYAIALCHYKMGNFTEANRNIAEIIDRGVKDYPELGVGLVTEGLDVRSVGNSLLLHETCLIEACNLKFAIEYKCHDLLAARDALTDMPPRSEEELDVVTLHNQALANMETNLPDCFAKLQYLLSQNPFPPETFANLLLLYCMYEYYDLAADVLAENAHLTYRYLSKYMYLYFEALICQQSSSDEAYSKFDALIIEETNAMRKAAHKLNQAQEDSDDRALKVAVEERDTCLERLLPVVMAQARIDWERGAYDTLEKLFHRVHEHCGWTDTFKLNVANTLFMLEKFKDSAGFYEALVVKKEKDEDILEVNASVLANLCVCWIMMNQNEDAEALIRKVARAEEELADKKSFHSCIMNLVIGTLYCSKGNSEFGLTRINHALEPYDKKLGVDTWFYTKRCVLAVLEAMSKHLVITHDEVMNDTIKMLEECEIFGKEISTAADGPLVHGQVTDPSKSVAYESRILHALVLRVIGM